MLLTGMLFSVIFVPCGKLSQNGSEWQRSARCQSASPDTAAAGYLNRESARWIWLSGTLSPASLKDYNRKDPELEA